METEGHFVTDWPQPRDIDRVLQHARGLRAVYLAACLLEARRRLQGAWHTLSHRRNLIHATAGE